MGAKYNVYFRGEIQQGQDPDAVRAKLGRLFKADDSTLDRLFSGKTQLIKKACDGATADKFKHALEQAGAVPILKQLEPEAAEQSAPTADPSPGGPTLAAVGSELLRENERSTPPPVEVDTSSMDLAEAGARLSVVTAEPPPAPDTSHLSTAEPGETIPTLPGADPIPEPDTSALELCPEGTDFSDIPGPEIVAPEVELSTLELAQSGADLLRPEEREPEKPPAATGDDFSLE